MALGYSMENDLILLNLQMPARSTACSFVSLCKELARGVKTRNLDQQDHPDHLVCRRSSSLLKFPAILLLILLLVCDLPKINKHTDRCQFGCIHMLMLFKER